MTDRPEGAPPSENETTLRLAIRAWLNGRKTLTAAEVRDLAAWMDVNGYERTPAAVSPDGPALRTALAKIANWVVVQTPVGSFNDDAAAAFQEVRQFAESVLRGAALEAVPPKVCRHPALRYRPGQNYATCDLKAGGCGEMVSLLSERGEAVPPIEELQRFAEGHTSSGTPIYMRVRGEAVPPPGGRLRESHTGVSGPAQTDSATLSPKSRSVLRREAIQRGEAAPTFEGEAVPPPPSEPRIEVGECGGQWVVYLYADWYKAPGSWWFAPGGGKGFAESLAKLLRETLRASLASPVPLGSEPSEPPGKDDLTKRRESSRGVVGDCSCGGSNHQHVAGCPFGLAVDGLRAPEGPLEITAARIGGADRAWQRLSINERKAFAAKVGVEYHYGWTPIPADVAHWLADFLRSEEAP